MKKYLFIVLVVMLVISVWFVVTQTDYVGGDDTKLIGTDWQWQETRNADGTTTTASDPAKFVLRFSSDGQFTSGTDCNRLAGKYVVDGEVLSLGQMISTKMFCEGSQETVYATALSLSTSYQINGNTLTIILNRDAGTMTFHAKK